MLRAMLHSVHLKHVLCHVWKEKENIVIKIINDKSALLSQLCNVWNRREKKQQTEVPMKTEPRWNRFEIKAFDNSVNIFN